jgi:RNA polymerase sigma-70 factor (ECF subfamily)
MVMEERELVNKFKEGDEESFRIIVGKYQKYVLNICFRLTRNKESAEDLTQEVFIEVYRSINYFRGGSKFSTWIYRIAVTKSLDYLKSQKRKKRFAVIKSLFVENDVEAEVKAIADLENNPLQKIEQEDRIKILSIALESLPEKQRVAFILNKYDELSYQEIADILGTTISSIESLIHRAKNNLRKKLYNYYKKHL